MLENCTELVGLYRKHFEKLREVYDRALVNNNFESLVVYSGEIKTRFQDDTVIKQS